MSETLNLNPEESLPEQNPPKPDKKNVDKGAVEREAAERDERRAKESESVLDKEPEKGETMDVKAEETRIEKNPEAETGQKEAQEKKNTDFYKEAEAELENYWPKRKEQGIIDMRVDIRMQDEEYMKNVRNRSENELLSLAVSQMDIQEKDFLNKTGKFEVRGVFGIKGAKIEAREVEGLLAEGLTLDQIRNIKINFFGKVFLPGRRKPIDSEKFDNLVDRGMKGKYKEVVTEDTVVYREKQRQEWVDWHAGRLEYEEKLRQEEERLAKKIKKQEAEAKARIEKAEKMPVEEKLGLLNDLEYEWTGANKRHRKIKAIEKALKAGEYKCKTEDGKKLKGKEARDEMERFKEELKYKNRELSDKIINTANQLTGRKLREEAREVTGYVPDKENPDEEKQKQFRTWLTKEAQKIFREQVDKIEGSSGMRIKTMRWLEKLMAGLPDMPTREKTGVKQRETIDAEEPSPAEKPLIKKGKKLKPAIKNRRQKK